jgi:hypothetical protein
MKILVQPENHLSYLPPQISHDSFVPTKSLVGTWPISMPSTRHLRVTTAKIQRNLLATLVYLHSHGNKQTDKRCFPQFLD